MQVSQAEYARNRTESCRMEFSQLKKIDVHHHYFPSTLSSDKKDAAARLGWRPPAANLPWSPKVSLAFMDKAGIDMAILSFPGFPSNDGNKELVSARNQEMAAICALHPTRFAFFASLPHLADTAGTEKRPCAPRAHSSVSYTRMPAGDCTLLRRVARAGCCIAIVVWRRT